MGQATNASEPIRTVVAATDFSPTAAAAADWAADLARRHQARLVLVHALSPPIPPAVGPEPVALPSEFHERVREAASQRLEEACERARSGGLEVTPDLQVGPAVATLVEALEKHAADLLVQGTRGLTGVRHLLLGSTAERVIQRAPCPVLTVHPEDAEKHRPVRTILVPTDFSEDAACAVREARRLLRAEAERACLVLLHAGQLPVEFTVLGPGIAPAGVYREVAEQARQELESLAEPLRSDGLKVRAIVREGYAAQIIEEEARTQEADLIALGTRGLTGLRHLLLGSTSQRVLQRAPCPVLTVRRSEA